jgi:hypothetical protein
VTRTRDPIITNERLEDEQAKSNWNWVVVVAGFFMGAFIMKSVLGLL